MSMVPIAQTANTMTDIEKATYKKKVETYMESYNEASSAEQVKRGRGRPKK